MDAHRHPVNSIEVQKCTEDADTTEGARTGAGPTVGDTTAGDTIEGGTMPIPFVAGVMLGAGTLLTGSHAVRKAHETQEFWKDYRKNTGLSARYPFRAGVYDFYRDVGHTSIGIGALYGRIL